MRIGCTSDWHGNIPDIPECDLLLIAGDIAPHSGSLPDGAFQATWMENVFQAWVDEQLRCQPDLKIVATAGNHDFWARDWFNSTVVRGVKFLLDSSIMCNGLKIHGCPWSLPFYDWAFMAPEERLEQLLSFGECDILLSHGPPFGILDDAKGEECGSLALLDYITSREPELVVCGHIHQQPHPMQKFGRSTIINAAYLDNRYRPYREPIVYESVH